ncbi:MAG: response regulator transcription factor [Flavobacteriales bacterium]
MTIALHTRVSIVEDDARVREVLSEIIAGAPDMELQRVHANAEDALAAEDGAGVDVIVMDINLPGQSGIDCVRQLAQRSRAVQFLMYTMFDDDQRVFEALKAGANGYILKTSKPGEILDAIRELARGGSPMSAPVARRVVAQLRATEERGDLSDAKLTDRESTVLELLAQGLLYKEISERLGMTEGAIKQHIHRMYDKLHVQNRTEAVNRFFGR